MLFKDNSQIGYLRSQMFSAHSLTSFLLSFFSRFFSKFSAIALFVVFIVNTGWGQVSITTAGSAVTQNFNGMVTSVTATLPTGFKIGTDWSSGTTATTLGYGSTGTGAVTGTSSGGAINWANGITGSATDRALGFLSTGSYTSPRSIISVSYTHLTLPTKRIV